VLPSASTPCWRHTAVSQVQFDDYLCRGFFRLSESPYEQPMLLPQLWQR
jgi:hypothetical protein